MMTSCVAKDLLLLLLLRFIRASYGPPPLQPPVFLIFLPSILPCCVYIPAVLFKVPFEYSSKYLRLAAAFVLHDTRHTTHSLGSLTCGLPFARPDARCRPCRQTTTMKRRTRPGSWRRWRGPPRARPRPGAPPATPPPSAPPAPLSCTDPPPQAPVVVGVARRSVGLVAVVVLEGAACEEQARTAGVGGCCGRVRP